MDSQELERQIEVALIALLPLLIPLVVWAREACGQ